MSHPFDPHLADDPPVRPERVMPAVTIALIALAAGLVVIGLATLWPIVADWIPAVTSPLAWSTALFGVVLVVVAALASRRRARDRKRFR